MSSSHLYSVSDAEDPDESRPAESRPPADRLREQERKIGNLETALQNARGIGIAIGILMANHKLTQQVAFARLAAASQARNRKLHLIAAEVVEVGALMDPDPARHP
jgi:hypothetical protein